MLAVRHSFILLLAALGLWVLSSTVVVVAQQDPEDEQQAAGDEADPPTRAARLSYLEGSVSVQPAGVDDWTAATINRPLTSGDQLWSDRASRAEVELGSASLSLADSSSVSLLNLSDQAVQLQVSAGTASITLRDLDPSDSFEIDAPNAAVSLVRPGSYRIAVDDAGNTTVALRDGQAQVITSAGQSVILRGGQGAQFAANGGVDVAPLGPPDAFDRWCAQREQRWTRNQNASQYVSSDVVGAEELDNNGEWREEPDYGHVWYPQVDPDWAPYRYGRWLWVSPWGWTWVDSAPWGYAPFHYGRWAYLRHRWAWVPAPPHSRAVYAPALVAWIGGPAGGAAISVGAGPGVGWLPLAPGEVYLPGSRVSRRYLHNVNVTNTTIVNNTYITNVYQNPALQNRYANRDAPRAMTVVSQSSFASGRSVAGHLIAPPAQWHGTAATPRPPGIVPARQSVLGPAAQTPVKRPPVAIINRPVVARHEPPPAPPPFERQIDAIRANGGRALPPAQLQRLRGPESPRANVVVAPPAPHETPVTPARPVTPDRHVMPATPATPAAPAPSAGAAAPPSPSTPIDRRAIPERSPRAQPPVQGAPPVQARPQEQVQPQPRPPVEAPPAVVPAPPPRPPVQLQPPVHVAPPPPPRPPIQVQPQPREPATDTAPPQRMRVAPPQDERLRQPQTSPPPPPPPPQVLPPHEVAAPPAPPPPPPPAAQPQPKPKPAPPAQRPELRKGEQL